MENRVVQLLRGRRPEAQPLRSGGNGSDPNVSHTPQLKAAGGNHQEQVSELAKLSRQVAGQGQALLRVIDHLQSQGNNQPEPLMSLKERRDLFQVLSDPPDDLLPQFTDVSPMMATMIPAMDVIRWNYTPKSERPIHPITRRPYGMYLLWETSYARWSLSKAAHNAIRMSDVVQARGPEQTTRFGVTAD